jgi:drug/metabolite transporter (DMT)-like permease
MQILAIRGVVTAAGALLVCFLDGGTSAMRTERPVSLIVRGLLNFLTIVLFVTAVATLPLADAMAIAMAAPLFTLTVCYLMGERVGIRRWSACVVGFVGVVIMLRPGGSALNIGGLAAVGAALCYALLVVQTRRLTATETNGAMLLYSAMVVLIASAALAPLHWVSPTLADVGLMVAAGICVSLGHYWLVQGYRYGTPTVLAPIDYTSLFWGALMGWLIWGDVPDAGMVAGATLVVGAGLYVVMREARLKRHADKGAKDGIRFEEVT